MKVTDNTPLQAWFGDYENAMKNTTEKASNDPEDLMESVVGEGTELGEKLAGILAGIVEGTDGLEKDEEK